MNMKKYNYILLTLSQKYVQLKIKKLKRTFELEIMINSHFFATTHVHTIRDIELNF